MLDVFAGEWLYLRLVRIHIANNFAYPDQPLLWKLSQFTRQIDTSRETSPDIADYRIDAAFMLNDMLYFRYSPNRVTLWHWNMFRPDVLVAHDKLTIERLPEHNIELQHGYQFDWQIEEREPKDGYNFAVKGFPGMHIDNAFYGHYITADTTHIYLGPSVGVYSAYDIDGNHAPLDIDTNGVDVYSPFGQAGLVSVGDRMYLPGSDSEGGVDEKGYMEITLFGFAK